MIVWALFDSGNGCYKKTSEKLEDLEVYSLGLDKENKNTHFINIDLSSYGQMFGKDEIIDTLNDLPKPDLIIASPPCESWSNASAMKGGNASWKKEEFNSLFTPQEELSEFTVRTKNDYKNHRFNYDRSFLNRVNGELTIYNTLRIIDKYKPKFWVIENPGTSKIWNYITNVLDFKIPFINKVYYSNYDYPLQKYTKFASNVNLKLNDTPKRGEGNMKKIMPNPKGYNERSNIPDKLVEEIFIKIKKEFEKTN